MIDTELNNNNNTVSFNNLPLVTSEEIITNNKTKTNKELLDKMLDLIEEVVEKENEPTPKQCTKKDIIFSDGRVADRDGKALIHNRPLTDFGNAERMVDQFSSYIRYCHQNEFWYIWNSIEGRWKIDEAEKIYRLSKDVTRRILLEAAHAPIDEVKKKIFLWGLTSECKPRQNGMIDLARTDPAVQIKLDDIDKDNMLFNLRNGTFNLKTLVLQPHNKEDNISKLADFEYDPTAKCPLFLKYLERIFRSSPKKDEIILFLQRAVGYTLTGLTQEQCLFLLYGKGSNGKSVFLDILKGLMGEYGTKIISKSFTTERGEQSNDIAALSGRRYVFASENASGSKLDESMVKELTGGEDISARFLHKEFFTYRPRFKLWWGFNHLPIISDMTNSIWRRVKIIPFTEILPESEWDKELADKIVRDEISGVFNWAVKGLGEYNQYGLQQPEIITSTIDGYKNDQDILLDFFTTNYEFTESELDMVKASDLYASYKAWWFSIESTKPMSSNMFGRLCRDRGLNKTERREGTFYQKIRSIHQKFIQK
jgi:putative DNA primase/helicase